VPFFVAAWFGVTGATDAFFYVYGLILLLAGIFAPVVQSVLVPFVAEIRSQDESKVGPFLGGTLAVSVLGLTALGLLFLLAARPVLEVVSDFSAESLDLISQLLLETLPLLVLLTVTSLLAGTLNAYKRFALPAVSPGVRAIAVLAVIALLRGRIGVHSIAAGYVAGELLRCAVLLAYAARVGIRPSLRSPKVDPRLADFLKTASYQVAGMVALAFTPIVDKTMASWLATGSVSVLEYATRLYEIPMTFAQAGFFVVLLSHWSLDFYAGRGGRFKKEVTRTAAVVGALGALASLALILLKNPLVSLVYGRGEFPEEQLATVAALWAILLLGLGPTLFGRVFSRAFLVLKNTRLLMVSGIAIFTLKVAFNMALIRPMGLRGLAISTIITESVVAGLMLIWFTRIQVGTKQQEGKQTT